MSYLQINFILLMVSISLAALVAIITFITFQRKKDTYEDIDRKNVISWGVFFIVLIIQLGIMIYWKFFVTDSFLSNIFERITNTVFFLTALIKVVDIEISINKTFDFYKGYYFTILLVVVLCINIFIDPDLLKVIGPLQVVFLTIMTVGFSIFPIIFFYVAIKSTGEIKQNSLLVSAGAVFLGLGYLFRPLNLIAYRAFSPLLSTLIDYLYITSPVSIIIGIVLIFISFMRK